jgi:hypothetical protein
VSARPAAECPLPLAIPESGWYKISWVNNHPGWIAIIAALGGVLFGSLATILQPEA